MTGRGHVAGAFALSALFLAYAMPADAANITGREWGATPKGEKVELFTLKGAGGLEARITNYGGRIVNLYVPNAQGSKTDVELGEDSLADYLAHGGVFGAIVGRYAGR